MQGRCNGGNADLAIKSLQLRPRIQMPMGQGGGAGNRKLEKRI